MRRLSLILLSAVALIAFSAHTGHAELGSDVGFSDVVYWEGDESPISYGGAGLGVVWRPDVDLLAYDQDAKEWVKVGEKPGPIFLWTNYIAHPDTLPSLEMGGFGYDVYEVGGFTIAPEVGGVLRGSTSSMQVGIIAGARMWHETANLLLRVDFGYVAPDVAMLLFKIGLALP